MFWTSPFPAQFFSEQQEVLGQSLHSLSQHTDWYQQCQRAGKTSRSCCHNATAPPGDNSCSRDAARVPRKPGRGDPALVGREEDRKVSPAGEGCLVAFPGIPWICCASGVPSAASWPNPFVFPAYTGIPQCPWTTGWGWGFPVQPKPPKHSHQPNPAKCLLSPRTNSPQMLLFAFPELLENASRIISVLP